MSKNERIIPTDLALVVWPRQSEPEVTTGERTWQEAASAAWAMDEEKASRVRLLIAVYDDVIQGAWRVEGVNHDRQIPTGKTRHVNRSSFSTEVDGRLEYLVGVPSPLKRRRNPQATIEVRDLAGHESLLDDSSGITIGTVQVGDFVLTVNASGAADLLTPPGASVSIRSR